MHNINEPVYYGEYLELDKLLDSQNPKSKKIGNEAHDETLFIIVHQVYELWFKQILHELHSVREIFDNSKVEESQLSTVVHRLERIKKIQGVLIDQLDVMESMTPMDFLEFRDLLVPASGFQSVQFREIEILMGLKTNQRKEVDRQYFLGRLK
ncbi:tryptophan 2,3-dioxygenase family protein, partial [Bacteriovorax sp. DB6_IX]|uniref:tryptophan 2,3-dioxygenase family protein n=1 Tax=Bacteriovorax sp. DB6_IX TaxID=1353530 RepID=UPI00038A0E61